MKTILQAVAFLPLLAVSAFAAPSCRTELGTKSVARVPTTTSTITSSVRPTVTKTVQSTRTKFAGYTYTITTFTTETDTITDDAVTETFSSTTTLYNVETDTITSTVTATQTDTSTTSSTSTTVVPTTAGFKNIRDTINSNPNQKRGVKHPHEPRAASGTVAKGLLARTYPTKVNCYTTVPNTSTKTVTTTATPVTVTKPYWARVITTTDTIHTTTTLVPPEVSVTETSTSISSVTTFTTTFETSTTTTSTTTTSVLPGPTVFDACSDANAFGPNFWAGGKPYYASNVVNNGPGVASDFKAVADGAGSAVECCNACQRFGTCETFIFRKQNRNCFLLYHDGGSCSAQANHPNYILSQKGSDTGAGYVVGNGNCGFTYSGNSDGTVFRVG